MHQHLTIKDLVNSNAELTIRADGTLDLSDRGLTSVVGLESIDNINTVKNLILNNNYIRSITIEQFKACPSLVILDLSNNEIESIKSSSHTVLESLRELNLRFNNLNKMTKAQWNEILLSLPRIKKLDLRYNNLYGDQVTLVHRITKVARDNNTLTVMLGPQEAPLAEQSSAFEQTLKKLLTLQLEHVEHISPQQSNTEEGKFEKNLLLRLNEINELVRKSEKYVLTKGS